ALVSMVLAGCAQSATPASTPPIDVAKTIDNNKSLQCDVAKEWWRTGGTPIRGGVWAKSGGQASNLDPLSGSALPLSDIPSVYNTLLEQRACFFEDAEVTPSLVKSWQVSPDGTSWTMK